MHLRGWKKSGIVFAICALPGCAATPDDGGHAPAVTDPGTKPQATSAGGSGAHAHGPALQPNANRYKDTGSKPATGRSGSATLAARALLGKDGTTDVELTTGTLDAPGAPPGNIAKVQLKVLNGTGDVVLTRNDNGLVGGGYVDERVPGLSRHAPLQVQTNIEGIDAHRTDVVTTPLTVELRPDLAASDLRAPARAWQGNTVLVGATIKELNGDVGARASCVLGVDGQEVDHADGIWVDAGGTVSCRFAYRFPASGVHAIAVRAANVVPGDWDTTNNTVTGSIGIVTPVPVEYSASASDVRTHDESAGWSWWNQTYWQQYWWYWWWGNGGYSTWTYASDSTYDYRTDARYQSAQFDTWFGRGVSFPLTKAVVTETSDGAPVSQTDFSGQPADFVSGTESCVQSWNGSLAVYLCSDSTSGQTHVHAQRGAGDVTYHSFNYYAWYESWTSCWWGWWGWGGCSSGSYGGSWSSNYDATSSQGTFVPMGSSYAYGLSLTDGDLVYAPVSASVGLTPFSSEWGTNGTEQCSSGSWGWSSWWSGDIVQTASCRFEDHARSGVSGQTSGVQSSAPAN